MRTTHAAVVALLIAAAPSSLAFGQRLHVEPAVALADEVVRMRATGLASGRSVTLRAKRRDADGRMWESAVAAVPGADGTIDLSKQAPSGGSYAGTAPMGLLTSMDVVGESRGRVRYSFAWRDTLRTEISLEVDGRIVSVDTIVQTFAGPGVRVRAIRENGLVATLFTPAKPAPAAAVLILGGSEGGLGSEETAAVLASRGFVALSVAYFGVDGLPSALDEIPIEYLTGALDFLASQGGVRRDAIGILGTSKGAEAALLVGSMRPDVRAVVAYAPSHVVWSCICNEAHSSWSKDGAGLPNVPAGQNPAYRPPAGTPMRPTENYVYRLRDSAVAARAVIPVERIKAPILLVVGDDDGLWPSSRMGREIMSRRKRLGGSVSDVLLEYAGAGHLIAKTYIPAGSTLIAGGRIDTGGSPAGNAAAQAESWPKVLAFLRQNLERRP